MQPRRTRWAEQLWVALLGLQLGARWPAAAGPWLALSLAARQAPLSHHRANPALAGTDTIRMPAIANAATERGLWSRRSIARHRRQLRLLQRPRWPSCGIRCVIAYSNCVDFATPATAVRAFGLESLSAKI